VWHFPFIFIISKLLLLSEFFITEGEMSSHCVLHFILFLLTDINCANEWISLWHFHICIFHALIISTILCLSHCPLSPYPSTYVQVILILLSFQFILFLLSLCESKCDTCISESNLFCSTCYLPVLSTFLKITGFRFSLEMNKTSLYIHIVGNGLWESYQNLT
jgi:hypothetical protein